MHILHPFEAHRSWPRACTQRTRAKYAQNRSTARRHVPKSAECSFKVKPNSDKGQSTARKHCPKPVEFGQTPAELGLNRVNMGRPTCAEFGHIWSKSGRWWPKLGQLAGAHQHGVQQHPHRHFACPALARAPHTPTSVVRATHVVLALIPKFTNSSEETRSRSARAMCVCVAPCASPHRVGLGEWAPPIASICRGPARYRAAALRRFPRPYAGWRCPTGASPRGHGHCDSAGVPQFRGGGATDGLHPPCAMPMEQARDPMLTFALRVSWHARPSATMLCSHGGQNRRKQDQVPSKTS